MAARRERLFEPLDLRALAAAVDAFDGDKSAGVRHLQKESNRSAGAPQRAACYDAGEMSGGQTAENLARVRERIAAAAARAGRRESEITLVAVSKTFPAEAIRAAFAAGVRHFGENRVQEWEAKRGVVADLGAEWHLVGHLQSNKAARAARLFDCVDSVDDAALAERLDRARAEMPGSKPLRVLIEVRLASEETKSGAEPGEL
ncbi:MAG TPA: YggS family pyridoxal phosphate-dependent enzyme, partial [Stellaceae bacterium]|nr:YggS family pyridoxal phosphate-dependent enzyme [Stellaceae bacterium]